MPTVSEPICMSQTLVAQSPNKRKPTDAGIEPSIFNFAADVAASPVSFVLFFLVATHPAE